MSQTGRCKRCDEERLLESRTGICFKCRAATRKTREQTDPELRERRLARMRIDANQRHRDLRAQALAAYGGCCVCCKTTWDAYLCIDHVAGNGAAHRLELAKGMSRTRSTTTMWRWLKNNHYPPGFQILCFNCNYAKDHGGCPVHD